MLSRLPVDALSTISWRLVVLVFLFYVLETVCKLLILEWFSRKNRTTRADVVNFAGLLFGKRRTGARQGADAADQEPGIASEKQPPKRAKRGT